MVSEYQLSPSTIAAILTSYSSSSQCQEPCQLLPRLETNPLISTSCTLPSTIRVAKVVTWRLHLRRRAIQGRRSPSSSRSKRLCSRTTRSWNVWHQRMALYLRRLRSNSQVVLCRLARLYRSTTGRSSFHIASRVGGSSSNPLSPRSISDSEPRFRTYSSFLDHTIPTTMPRFQRPTMEASAGESSLHFRCLHYVRTFRLLLTRYRQL